MTEPDQNTRKTLLLMCAVAVIDGWIDDTERGVLKRWARRHEVSEEEVESALAEVKPNLMPSLPMTLGQTQPYTCG